jgi:hypothetical protein
MLNYSGEERNENRATYLAPAPERFRSRWLGGWTSKVGIFFFPHLLVLSHTNFIIFFWYTVFQAVNEQFKKCLGPLSISYLFVHNI